MSPDHRPGLVSTMVSTAHTGFTMARRGLLIPGRPDRTAAQLAALARWGTTLAGGFGSAARRSPHASALVDPTATRDFAQLNDRADRLAAGLEPLLRTDTRVGVLCRNHSRFVETLVAAAKLGADVVLLNTGLSAEQVRDSIARHRIGVTVTDPEFLEAGLDGPGTTISTAPAPGLRTVDDLIDAADDPPRRRPPVQRGRTIVLTSGTTGTPKGARRPTPGVGDLTSILSRIPLRVRDRALITAPLFHTWGHAALQLAMAMRATILLPGRFDPEETLHWIATHRCTTMFAVPVMLQRILELPATVRARYDTGSLRVVATSGSALPGDLATRFMDAYGDVLYNLYGTTEVSWASIATPGQLRSAPHCSGRPPFGTTITIADAEGRPVSPGTRGRIFVGNRLLFDGYTDGADRLRSNGTMDTGDLGHLDATGTLFIDGRADDMIVSGGENVFPTEVENLLVRLPQVREAAVTGVDDARFGRRLCAYLVVRPGSTLTPEQVRDHVRAHLARFSVPRDVVFVPRLPRNATGKVVRRLLPPPGDPDGPGTDDSASGAA